MQLRYLDIGELITRAGGNPWQLGATLQDGNAGQIAELANSFYIAGVSMKETADEFRSARTSFEASWNRENGNHPINDSVEVQRTAEQLKLSKEQLARVGVDLENVAAALAEAQRASATTIEELEGQLQQLDDAIGQTLAQGTELYEEDLEPIKNLAAQDIKEAFGAIGVARDTYSGQLGRSINEMRAEGYGADAIDPADGEGTTAITDAKTEGAEYGFVQQAKDRALLDSPGPMTPDKEGAASRLRDYAAILDPNADLNAVRLAGERLDDFQKSTLPGPLRPDPITGANPTRRALARLEYQRELEKGLPWSPPMSPDEATAWMDQQESKARAAIIDGTTKQLEDLGLSRDAATSVVDRLAKGVPWNDLLSQDGELIGGASSGIYGLGKDLPTAERRYIDALTPSEIETIRGAGKYLGTAGNVLDVGLAIWDVSHGAPAGERFGESLGGIGGGALGAWAAATATASIAGPEATFIAAVVGGVALSKAGGWVGGKVGSWGEAHVGTVLGR
ncbi:hypothetical protein BH09ACT8_BH09ACT8_07860 [soil metagenome]